jgi:biotin synthase
VQFVVCVPQDQEAPSGLDLVRCIATARIVMPRTVVRLSAGRLDLSAAEQALAFMAGANSIFDGDKLLTTPNNDRYVAWQQAGTILGC